LTTLPRELFDYICDIVSTCYLGTPSRIRRTYLGGVSRVFLHNERIRHFQSISITKIERLDKLYAAVTGSPGCGPYVGNIELSFMDPSESKTPLRNEHLVALLEGLPSLYSLRVQHFPRLTRLLTDPPRWFLHLPDLVSLDLVDNFDDWDDPYNPIHWVNLWVYPNLRSFGLSVQGAGFDGRGARKFNSSMIEVPAIYSVTNLQLQGRLGSAPSLLDLYSLFPNVVSLSLEEVSWEEESLDKALETFPDPTQIKYLSLTAFYGGNVLADSTVRQFSNLVTLRLDGAAYDSTLIPVIDSAFKGLRKLDVGRTVQIDHRDVRRLFEEIEALDVLHVSQIRIIENRKPISHISKAHVTTLLDLVNDARMKGVELDGRAIRDAKETKRRMDRVAKAKAEGTTYEQMKRDEMLLHSGIS